MIRIWCRGPVWFLRFGWPGTSAWSGWAARICRRAGNVGLERWVGEHLRVSGKTGVNGPVKVGSLVAGMVAGADCIDDMDLLRHGAMPDTFGGVRAPSTLGSFLRAFDHGNVRQLQAVYR